MKEIPIIDEGFNQISPHLEEDTQELIRRKTEELSLKPTEGIGGLLSGSEIESLRNTFYGDEELSRYYNMARKSLHGEEMLKIVPKEKLPGIHRGQLINQMQKEIAKDTTESGQEAMRRFKRLVKEVIHNYFTEKED